MILTVKTFNITASATAICNTTPKTAVILTAPSGTNYQWKESGLPIAGATNQTYSTKIPGNYTCTLTDALCGIKVTALISINFANPPAKPVISPSPTAFVCAGFTTNLYTTTGYPLYKWSYSPTFVTGGGGGATIIPTATTYNYNTGNGGYYWVQVTDNLGCVSQWSYERKLTVNPTPNPMLSIAPQTNGSVTLGISDANTNLADFNVGGTYTWYLNGSVISGVTGQSYNATLSGTYKVHQVNTWGCTAFTPDYSVTTNCPCVKLDPNVDPNNISSSEPAYIYPNPSNGIYTIYATQNLRAVVRNVQGSMILDIPNAKEVNISDKANGIYMLQLYNDKGDIIKSTKLIKE